MVWCRARVSAVVWQSIGCDWVLRGGGHLRKLQMLLDVRRKTTDVLLSRYVATTTDIAVA